MSHVSHKRDLYLVKECKFQKENSSLQKKIPLQNNPYLPAQLVKGNAISRARKCPSFMLQKECHKMSS